MREWQEIVTRTHVFCVFVYRCCYTLQKGDISSCGSVAFHGIWMRQTAQFHSAELE